MESKFPAFGVKFFFNPVFDIKNLKIVYSKDIPVYKRNF